MTVLQIILFFTHMLMIAIGYQMGHQDGFKEGRYANRIGGQR